MRRRELIRLQTPRLLGEPLSTPHLDELVVFYGHPQVARWLFPRRRPPDRDGVRARLEAHERHWQRHGYGLWLLRDRRTGAFLGQGGLKRTDATGEDELEVGWAVHPDRWGEGLATELARHSVTAAFRSLQAGDVVAYTLPGNRASRRVMEKLGMRRERRFRLVNELYPEGLEQVLYRIRREDW